MLWTGMKSWRFVSDQSRCSQRPSVCFCNYLETVFERGKSCPGFAAQPYILEQPHQPQSHAGGLEAAAHLSGKLVVKCEHGSESFRGAGDVSGTLRSPWSGCLIHEVNGGKQRCWKSDAPVRRVLSRLGSMT